MSECYVNDIYVGKYVLVQLVDSTTEITVEDNIYSLTEAMELQKELLEAMNKLVSGLLLLKEAGRE
tara:strand:+ start:2151 stop:2348 length:198 start_codon:yes stop_codon:yes gene_type:complete